MINLGFGFDNTNLSNCCSSRQPRFLVGKILPIKVFRIKIRIGFLGVNLGICKYENPLRKRRERFILFIYNLIILKLGL